MAASLLGALVCVIFTANFMGTGGLYNDNPIGPYMLLVSGLSFIGTLLSLIAFFGHYPSCALWGTICYTVAFAAFVLLGSIAYLIIPVLCLLSLALYAPPVIFGWIGYARARRQSDD